MPFLPSLDGPIAFSDEAIRRIEALRNKVVTVRERWYLGVPSILMPIGEDLSDISPSIEIIDHGIEFDS